MGKPDPDKVASIKAFFDELNQRIENLTNLNSNKCFRDEALILCLVYIDGLASYYYKGGEVNERFCRALRELGGNALFGKLHVKVLLGPDTDAHWAGPKTGENGAKAKLAVEELARGKQGQLLDESEVAAQIRSSGVDRATGQLIINHLWRSSIGAICYEMRNSAVHCLGTKTLTFDQTLYEGELGFALNFDVLHRALRHISDHIAKESVDKGEWFGRKDYFKTR